MQITALNQGIKDKERVNVFIDGNFRIALDKTTLAQEKLFVGMTVDSKLLERLKDLDAYNLVSRKILSWVLLKPRSSKEISDKVKKIVSTRSSSSFDKNIDTPTLIEFVIGKLSEYDFNDKTFGKWWVENRHSQGKYGKNRVYAELLKKGVNSRLAKELVNSYYLNDTALAKSLLQKKYGVSSIKDIKDFKLRSKAYRLLVSKGFSIV